MSSEKPELLLTVPADLVARCQGLALDMGGSVLKFVYRTKDDAGAAAANGNKFSRLHLVSFGQAELQQGLDYIKDRAYYQTEIDQTPMLFTTGIGCTTYGKVICQTLNIRLNNVAEFDCFCKSFFYLAAHVPRQELLELFDVEAVVEPVEFTRAQLDAMVSVQSKNLTQAIDFELIAAAHQNLELPTGRPPGDAVQPPDETALAIAETDTFPCLLVMCGSGFGFMKVEKDGTFKCVDGSNRGGRGFCGVGSLLTGCKSFDELIDLASKGDHSNLDQYSNDLFSSHGSADDDQSLYAMLRDVKPQLVFCFGKAATGDKAAGEFRREDIASAWLNWLILDLVQCVHNTCLIQEVNRVFFCGGFCTNRLVRQLMTTELARRNMFWTLLSQRSGALTFDFVKAGQHLGALGCMINGL